MEYPTGAKAAFQFDHMGFFAGETLAFESPLEPSVFVLPAGCTFTPPPASLPAGKIARWNGSSWKAARPPKAPKEPSPEEKLAEFMATNPDVVALLAAQAAAQLAGQQGAEKPQEESAAN